MRKASLIFVSLSLTAGAAQATQFVVGPTGSIQNAITLAANGDTIEVQGGTHVENINFLGKAITVFTNVTTTIDGGLTGSTVTFNNGEGLSSVLAGFRIKNGQTAPFGLGGGIYCNNASPTILNCFVQNNKGDLGGGIALLGSNASIRDCTIMDSNVVFSSFSSAGGNLYISGGSPKIIHCGITYTPGFTNSWALGAGIYVTGSATPLIRDCSFSQNLAGTAGGALFVHDGVATVRKSGFSFNHASSGAAIATDSSGAIDVRDCEFISNSVTGSSGNGGAIQLKGGGTSTINTSTIFGNTAGGRGGGIYAAFGITTIQNCILYNNTNTSGAAGPDLAIEQSAQMTVAYTDLLGGQAAVFVGAGASLTWGSGNINANPMWYGVGNFHLTSTSPCIDAGDPAFVVEKGEVDFTDREPRLNGTIDMGYDEFRDCNGNGTADWLEIFSDCNGNHVPDSCDIASGASMDLDGNGTPDECQNSLGSKYCYCPVPISPCGNFDPAAGCQNSLLYGGLLSANGTASVAADNVRFVASHLPSTVSTTLFVGDATHAPILFTDGLICAGGTIRRLGATVTNASGNASWGPGLNAGLLWSAGQTRYFQTEYRNPTGPCGTTANLTSGVQITFVP